MEVGNNLIPNSHSRPADILLPNWVIGKPAAFDPSVTPLLNSSTLLEAGVKACLPSMENAVPMMENVMSLAGYVYLS